MLKLNFIRKFSRNCLLASGAFLFTAQASATTEIAVGYQQIVGPFVSAIASKRFEDPLKEAGYTVKWRQFNSAGDISSALASGGVPIGVMGSTAIAAATTRGVNMQLFWVLDNIGHSEALVVRDGANITKPEDLIGKKVGVPFVSTAHFHLLVALDKMWKMPVKDVKLLSMTPPQIVSAWKRGDIDAAYIWPPALSEILKTGKVLTDSAEVAKASVPTFDGIVVDTKWAKANPKFMAAFTKVLAEIYDEYNVKKDSYTVDSPEILGITKMIGGTPQDVLDALKLLVFPTSKEMVSNTWLGGGKDSGAVNAFSASADFLKEQKQINKVLPSYEPYVNSTFAQEAAK